MNLSERSGEMMGWAADLFPICRSITGNGVRRTLNYISDVIGGLEIHEVPTGEQAFDWEVPEEWNIRGAQIRSLSGDVIVDFSDHNLHVVGYSTPIDKVVSIEELDAHLHSLPNEPNAIPYVTSYYNRTWGFCVEHARRKMLKDDHYHVVIDSELKKGHLTYGDVIIPGQLDQEVLFSTYVCHPSMANNEISGPCVAMALARIIKERPRKYTYRFVFIPETIGSIVYLSRNYRHMKQKTVAGWVLSCVGDNGFYSMLASREGDTLADRLTKQILIEYGENFKYFDYLWPNRGSDERNYCSPGIDLPVVGFMRTKYGQYKEYHTSLDDMSFISKEGLEGSLKTLVDMIEVLENNDIFKVTVHGEPRLGPRGLYPTMNKPGVGNDRELSAIMNVLAYADGTRDLLQLAERIGLTPVECLETCRKLLPSGLLSQA